MDPNIPDRGDGGVHPDLISYAVPLTELSWIMKLCLALSWPDICIQTVL